MGVRKIHSAFCADTAAAAADLIRTKFGFSTAAVAHVSVLTSCGHCCHRVSLERTPCGHGLSMCSAVASETGAGGCGWQSPVHVLVFQQQEAGKANPALSASIVGGVLPCKGQGLPPHSGEPAEHVCAYVRLEISIGNSS